MGGVIAGVVHSEAAPATGIQNISVQIGPDGSILSLSSSTVSQGASEEVSGASKELDPQVDGQILPIRVTTIWWMDGESGTNLGGLAGKSGRVTIEKNPILEHYCYLHTQGMKGRY